MGKQVELLKDHADLTPNLPQMSLTRRDLTTLLKGIPNALSLNLNLSGIDLFQSHQDPQDRRFARAARANQSDFFRRRRGKIEIVQYQQITIGLADPLYF